MTGGVTSAPRRRRDLAVLLLVSGLGFTLNLGGIPVFRRQEVRVLETAREMDQGGDWIVPRFSGEVRLEKPPLAYWLALGGFRLRGEPDEVGGRLFSAFAGVLTVLLLHAFGLRLGSPGAGLWSGLILASSPLFLRCARRAETDALLTCAVTAAFYSFHRALEPREGPGRPRLWPRLWSVLAWGAMGIAFLAKGPAGLLLPVLPLFLYLALARRWAALGRLFYLPGMALFLALAAPWFIAAADREGIALPVFLREMRTAAAGLNHPGEGLLDALFYYPLELLVSFAPWFIFLFLAVPAAWQRRRSESGPGFLLAWAGGILLQLQLVGNKQVHYLLPALPPLALLAGWWIASPGVRRGPFARPWLQLSARGILAAMLAGMLIWSFLPSRRADRVSCRSFALAVRPVVGASPAYLRGADSLRAPLLDFYLRRVVPRLAEGPGELEAILARGGPFYLISAEPIPGDRRFELVHSSSPPEAPLHLYRAGREAAPPVILPAAGRG